MSRDVSSLVATPPSSRQSANITVVCVVGPPRLHSSSFEEPAFLSESSNRVIIIGRNLGRDSDSMCWKAKGRPDIQNVSTIVRRKSGERTKKMFLGITYVAGSCFNGFYKGIKSRREKMVKCGDLLTLANTRNITSTSCEANMSRK